MSPRAQRILELCITAMLYALRMLARSVEPLYGCEFIQCSNQTCMRRSCITQDSTETDRKGEGSPNDS